MSTNVQQYLSKMDNTHFGSKIHQRVKHLNTSVLNDVGNQIIQSRIIIPQHQKKFKLKTTPTDNQNQYTKLDTKFTQLKSKKKALLQELQAVQLMENTIKLSQSTLKQSNTTLHTGKNAKIRSQFTEEQLSEIKQIYRKQKKFQRKIAMKIKKYQEDVQHFKKQKQDQQKQKHRQLCMEKHQQRQKYIKQIQKRNNKRQEILTQQKQKIFQLKKKQKLFQKLQGKFLQEKQLESQEIKQKLEQYKKKRQFSFDDMKRHQQEYLQRKRVQDEERDQKLKNFKNANETKFPCLFLQKIKDQEQRLMYEQQEKKQIVKNFVQRKTAYAEQVRKHLLQKAKTMSASKLSDQKQTKVEPKWLNTPQKYKQGTNYMREVNLKIAKMPRKFIQKLDEQNRPKFKNYLVQLKNQDPQKKKQAKQKNVNNVVNNMSIISAKENITSSNLAKSVKAKIQLMNKLQNMQ